MRLMIDPPMGLETEPAIRAWLAELAQMRVDYRDDPEALGCIASCEQQAKQLLIDLPNLPRFPTRDELAELWMGEVAAITDEAELALYARRFAKKYKREEYPAVFAVIDARTEYLRRSRDSGGAA